MDDFTVMKSVQSGRRSIKAKAQNRLGDGFKGQIWHFAPPPLLRQAELDPLIMDFYPTDVGWFPSAKNHYRERQHGAHEHILIYCVSGFGWFELNGRRRQVRAGEAFLIPRKKPHRYGADEAKPWSIYWAHFTGRLSALYADHFSAREDLVVVKPAIAAKARVVFQDCCASPHGSMDFSTTLFVSHALRYLLALLLFSNQKTLTYAFPPKGYDLTESIAFMKKRVGRTLPLQEIAKQAGLSISRFSAVFKAQTGLSPIDFFIRLRMQSASFDLITTDKRIKEIAADLGYQDPYYFSRLFHRTVGISPTTYRESPKG